MLVWPFMLPFTPEQIDRSSGLLATFVAPGGCNLRCSFCGIRQRGERDRPTNLGPEHFAYFVSDLAEHEPLLAVAVVGDEPLIEGGWPHTLSVLQSARDAGVPRALITNGTLLAVRMKALAEIELDSLFISLDGFGKFHDRTRGVEGAFEAAVRGLFAANSNPGLRDRIGIASTFQARRLHYLRGLPELLERHGVRRWLLSPVLIFGDIGRPPSCVGISDAEINELVNLREDALARGIETCFDEVFALNPSASDLAKRIIAARLPIRSLGSTLSLTRLLPDGTCSVDPEIFGKVSPHTAKWDGIQAPHEFVRGIRPMVAGLAAAE